MRLPRFGLAAAVSAALALSSAPADTLPPATSYKVATADGKHVFVMLGIVPPERDDPDIRGVYPRSGLYRKDDPGDPLWTVGWYAPHVYPASDGVHLVRPGVHAPGEGFLDAMAVAFYENGELLRLYTVGELVDDPARVPLTASTAHWLESESFDDATMLYTLRTADGNWFQFNARTGNLLAAYRGDKASAAIGLGAVAVTLVVGGLLWVVFRARARRRVTVGQSPRA